MPGPKSSESRSSTCPGCFHSCTMPRPAACLTLLLTSSEATSSMFSCFRAGTPRRWVMATSFDRSSIRELSLCVAALNSSLQSTAESNTSDTDIFHCARRAAHPGVPIVAVADNRTATAASLGFIQRAVGLMNEVFQRKATPGCRVYGGYPDADFAVHVLYHLSGLAT